MARIPKVISINIRWKQVYTKTLKERFPSYKQLPFPYIRLCFPFTHLAGVNRSLGSASITEILQKNRKITTTTNPRKQSPYKIAPVVLIDIYKWQNVVVHFEWRDDGNMNSIIQRVYTIEVNLPVPLVPACH